ncbi:MAG: hypothetical protein IJH94_06435 [Clostridia bacterium]|nr:hypothetical protein [Clostridia bacterium]
MNKRRFAISYVLALMITLKCISIPVFAEGESRFMEKLDRGTVAVKTADGVYISWRLLGTESLSDRAFDIYRDGMKIHTTGAHDQTCYTDTDGTENSLYTVVPKNTSVIAGKAVLPWTTNAAFDGISFAYMDIPFTAPENGTTPDNETYSYTAGDMSAADLDGDAEHVSDFDNDGRQEIFFVHEANHDQTVDVKRYNSETESGTEDIAVQSVAKDVGRGVMGNIDDDYARESGDLSLFWSVADKDNAFNMTGEAVGSNPGLTNFLA